MKCFECGGPMVETLETVKDELIGLDNVTLKNLPVRTCQKCGEREIGFPQMESLHRLIACEVIKKPARLNGQEIRFLRTYLDWSGADFARHMGVAPETVSRWENDAERIGPGADRLLRLYVAYLAPIEAYPIETLTKIAAKGKALRLRAVWTKKGTWELAAA